MSLASNQHDECRTYTALGAGQTHELSTQNLYLYIIRIWVKKLINATTAYSYDRESIFHLISLHYYLQIFFKA